VTALAPLRLGFGTCELWGPEASEAVRDAIAIGYRHLDTARFYENEMRVGIGMRESGVAREELFVTTKVLLNSVWALAPKPTMTAGRDSLRWATEDSLQRLDTDYLDLLLVHWPSHDVPLKRTLEAMTALQEEGLIRHVGVSNFPAGLLRRACELAPIFCDQVEYHPLLSQDRLLAAARELGVLVTAHSPLARGRILEDETLQRIGARHGRTAAQVALRWLIEQPGVGAIPTAPTAAWRRENWAVLDFALTDADRAEIARLPKDVRTVDPPFAPDWEA
jgi:2,5-diketo-D-gluconate reductase B